MKPITGLKVAGVVFGALCLMLLANFALSLLNRADDVAVGAGIFILLAEVIGLFIFVPKIYRSFLPKKVAGTEGETDAPRRSGGPGSSGLALLALIILMPMFGSLGGCSKMIGPGYEGIKVNNYGGNRGVSDIPLSTGRVFYNPFTETVFDYPTFVQTAVWTANEKEGKAQNEEISFNTQDNILVTVDVSLSYQLNPGKIPAFYVKFRSDDLSAFTDGFLHNIARDAFNELGGNYTVEEVNSTKKAEFLKAVRQRINGQTSMFGVELQQFGIIGGLRVPPVIQAAMNGKATAIQRAQQSQNELVQATADAAKLVAKAKGEADANAELTKSLSPELIQWRQLDIIEKKWNGAYPTVMGGSGTIPMIQLPGSK